MGLVIADRRGRRTRTPATTSTPKFDDVRAPDAARAGRVAAARATSAAPTTDADEKLGVTRALMGGEPDDVRRLRPRLRAAVATPSTRTVLNKVLNAATVNGTSAAREQRERVELRRRRRPTSRRPAGPAGRSRSTSTRPLPPRTRHPTYAAGPHRGEDALPEPDRPGEPGQAGRPARSWTRRSCANVDGSDSLHPNRSGDVVVVLRPPYQSDAGAPGRRSRCRTSSASTATCRTWSTSEQHQHARDVRRGRARASRTSDDGQGPARDRHRPDALVPDGHPRPAERARPDPLRHRRARRGLREVTILDISDFHGQLIPLTDTADNIAGTRPANPTFTIGGSAFLKKYFESTRPRPPGARTTRGVIEMAAGDSVGATPPISSFFEDQPTIEAMNMMGIDIDGIGNHNFDRSADFLRTS